MKTTFLLLFSFVVISTCSAQITKGTTFVGGSASYSKGASKSIESPDFSFEASSSTLNFNPKVGYFIADNLAVGLGINYYRFRSKTKSNGLDESAGNKQNTFGVNPFGRYYKMLGERAGFFGQLTPQDGLNPMTSPIKNTLILEEA